MLLLLLSCGLLALGSVFGEEETIDYSNVATRVEIENTLKWFPPPGILGASPEVDSSEHGVTPGRRSTSCLCGWANRAKGRIIGGKIHGRNEYPFIAGIAHGHQPTRPHCGSTIISPWHVLTAAHCTVNARSLVVTLGDYDRSGRERSTIIPVRRIMDHEQFNLQLLHNDISILFLERHIQQSATIGPACLPTGRQNLVGKKLRIIGWGAMQYNGPMTSLPQKVDVKVIDMPTCVRAWPYHVGLLNPRSQVCTHSRGKTACQGDSGGPVVWLDPETNRYVLAGAVSFGPHCKDDQPSVQTDVSAHLPWIMRKIQETAPGQQTCRKV